MPKEPKAKKSHDEVNYRPAKVGAKRRCGSCSMFIPHIDYKSHCTDVQDPIVPFGDCNIFAPKSIPRR